VWSPESEAVCHGGEQGNADGQPAKELDEIISHFDIIMRRASGVNYGRVWCG
jgi:hypothetical protein